MRKRFKSELDRFAPQLQSWFEDDKLTFREARQRLARRGVKVCHETVSRWWRQRRHSILEEQLLEQIERGATECAKVERLFREHPAPPIDTIVKLYRVIVLKLNNEANVSNDLLKLAADLLKPLMEWRRLDLKEKEDENASRLRRDEADLQREAEQRAANHEGLRPETLAQIERELKLL